VVLAMENHIDLRADELAELVQRVDSPWFGVCLDTANNLRLFEDPVRVARTLAPYTRATHVKDVISHRGDPLTFGFWPSVPLGRGAVDLPQVLRLLAEAGYDGLLAIEIDYLHPEHGTEDEALARSVDFLRGTLPTLRAAA
jgi:sugar phosphate isomerase/epimerase